MVREILKLGDNRLYDTSVPVDEKDYELMAGWAELGEGSGCRGTGEEWASAYETGRVVRRFLGGALVLCLQGYRKSHRLVGKSCIYF